jgi:hypothetical protein
MESTNTRPDFSAGTKVVKGFHSKTDLDATGDEGTELEPVMEEQNIVIQEESVEVSL